jgi:competence protein ComEC
MIITFTVVFYLGEIFGWILCGASLIIIGFAIFIKRFSAYKVEAIIVSAVVILSCLYSLGYTNLYFLPNAQKYDGDVVTIEAVCKASPYVSYSTYRYQLETTRINGNEDRFKILLKTSNQLDLQYGDTIKCSVQLSECDNKYYKSKGYIYTAEPENYVLLADITKAQEKDIGYIPVFLKDKMCHAVSAVITGDEGSLCNAVALGDKYGLSRDIYNDFSKTGLTYLIVVSGLHMSVVVCCVLILLKGLSKRRMANIFRCIIATAFVLMFMSITGFTSSVVRSGIMTVITLVGSAIWRKADPINSLGLSAFLLTVFNPYAVGDVGLLYSFASVFGIIVIYPAIMRVIEARLNEYKWWKGRIGVVVRCILSMLVASVSAVICIIPVSLANFGTCNILVIILSAFISPTITLLLVATLLCSVFWYVPVLKFISYFCGFLAYFLAKYVLFAVGVSVNLPYAQIIPEPFFVTLWLIFSGLSLLIVLFIKRKELIKNVVLCSYVFLIIGVCVGTIASYGDLSIDIYSSGNGTTAVLNCKGQRTVLSCGGDASSTSDVISRLSINNSTVKSLFALNRNYVDRYAENILSQFDVNQVLLYYNYVTNEKVYQLARSCENYMEITEGETEVDLGEGITDMIFSSNNRSWQYVYNSDVSIIIAPEGGSALEIPEKYRTADILVISKEVKNLDLLKYKKSVWTSTKDVPSALHDVLTVTENTVNINMK